MILNRKKRKINREGRASVARIIFTTVQIATEHKNYEYDSIKFGYSGLKFPSILNDLKEDETHLEMFS